MVKRREALIAVGCAVALAGCTGSEPEETADTVIDADVADIIVTLDDLESGWSGGSEGDGEAVFFSDDATVEIEITSHSDISTAEDAYNVLRDERTDSTSSDDVSYGNEGFLVNPFDDYVVIGFRAGNFVVEIESYTEEFARADPEDVGRDFANIIVDKIADRQND